MEHISNALDRCLTDPPIETMDTPPQDDDSATIFYNMPPEPPLEALPPEIRQMLKQASVSFKYAPIELPLVGFLSFLAICVGRSRALEVKAIGRKPATFTSPWCATTASGKALLQRHVQAAWGEDF